MSKAFKLAVALAGGLALGGCSALSSLTAEDEPTAPAAVAAVEPPPLPPDDGSKFCKRYAENKALLEPSHVLGKSDADIVNAAYRQCMLPLAAPVVQVFGRQ